MSTPGWVVSFPDGSKLRFPNTHAVADVHGRLQVFSSRQGHERLILDAGPGKWCEAINTATAQVVWPPGDET